MHRTSQPPYTARERKVSLSGTRHPAMSGPVSNDSLLTGPELVSTAFQNALRHLRKLILSQASGKSSMMKRQPSFPRLVRSDSNSSVNSDSYLQIGNEKASAVVPPLGLPSPGLMLSPGANGGSIDAASGSSGDYDLRTALLHVEKSAAEYIKLAENAFSSLDSISNSHASSSQVPGNRLANVTKMLMHKNKITSAEKLTPAQELSDSPVPSAHVPIASRSDLNGARALNRRQDAERMVQAAIQLLLESALQALQAESGAVFLFRPESQDMLCLGTVGDLGPSSRTTYFSVPADIGLGGVVMRTGIAFHVEDSNPVKNYASAKSVLVAPIHTGNTVPIGILRANSAVSRFNNDDEVRIVHFSSLFAPLLDRFSHAYKEHLPLYNNAHLAGMFPSRAFSPHPQTLIYRRKEIIPVVDEKGASAILSSAIQAEPLVLSGKTNPSLKEVGDYIQNLEMAWRKNVDQCLDLQDSVEQSEKTLLYLRAEIRQLRGRLAEEQEKSVHLQVELDRSKMEREREREAREKEKQLEREAADKLPSTVRKVQIANWISGGLGLVPSPPKRKDSKTGNTLRREDSRSSVLKREDSKASIGTLRREDSKLSVIAGSDASSPKRTSVSGAFSPSQGSQSARSSTGATEAQVARMDAIRQSLKNIMNSTNALIAQAESDQAPFDA